MHIASGPYLLLQYDVLPLPVFHHAQCLKSAYNVVRVDGHLLTDVCKHRIISLHMHRYMRYADNMRNACLNTEKKTHTNNKNLLVEEATHIKYIQDKGN